MDLRVVGGFLGSGKTTAIVSALHTLIAAGQRVGVITNDKGRFLVDTAFSGARAWPRQRSLAVASGATTVTSGTVSRSSSAMPDPMCCLLSP